MSNTNNEAKPSLKDMLIDKGKVRRIFLNYIPWRVAMLFVLLGIISCAGAFNHAYAQEAFKIPYVQFTPAGAAKPTHITSILAGATDTPVSGSLANCGPHLGGYPLNLNPGQAVRVTSADLLPYLCSDVKDELLTPSSNVITLFDVPAGAAMRSLVSFNDGANSYSLSIPPLGSISGNRKTKILGPVWNDDWTEVEAHSPEGSRRVRVPGASIANVTLFPNKPTPIKVEIVDGQARPRVEKFIVNPPVAQVWLETVGTYFVTVSIDGGCSFVDCSEYGVIFGFAHSGNSRGGSQDVHVFATEPQPVPPPFVFAGTF